MQLCKELTDRLAGTNVANKQNNHSSVRRKVNRGLAVLRSNENRNNNPIQKEKKETETIAYSPKRRTLGCYLGIPK
jgi:uncharacterized protein YjiK